MQTKSKLRELIAPHIKDRRVPLAKVFEIVGSDPELQYELYALTQDHRYHVVQDDTAYVHILTVELVENVMLYYPDCKRRLREYIIERANSILKLTCGMYVGMTDCDIDIPDDILRCILSSMSMPFTAVSPTNPNARRAVHAVYLTVCEELVDTHQLVSIQHEGKLILVPLCPSRTAMINSLRYERTHGTPKLSEVTNKLQRDAWVLGKLSSIDNIRYMSDVEGYSDTSVISRLTTLVHHILPDCHHQSVDRIRKLIDHPILENTVIDTFFNVSLPGGVTKSSVLDSTAATIATYKFNRYLYANMPTTGDDISKHMDVSWKSDDGVRYVGSRYRNVLRDSIVRDSRPI